MTAKKMNRKIRIPLPNFSDKTSRMRWFLRMLSLVFAVALWLFVTWDGSAMSTRQFEIPLKYTDTSDGYSISNKTSNITVVVEGRLEVLAILSRNMITASVSMNGLKPGTYRLPVQLSIPDNLRLVSYSPQVVDFSLFRIIERRLKPNLVVKGEMPHDFSIGNIEITPQEVVVKGSETEVLSVRRAEVSQTFPWLRLHSGSELPVYLAGDRGEVKGLTVEPKQVRVSVTFAEATDEATVPVKVPLKGVPADGLEVSSVMVSPDVVVLHGYKNTLSKIQALSTDPVDVSGIDSDSEFEVSMRPPEGTRIDVPGAAKVRVVLGSATETRTFFNVPVKVYGKSAYSNWKLSPSTVTVTIERPLSSKQHTERETPPVGLYVDVANVVSDQLTLPVLVRDAAVGIKVLRIEPAQVELRASQP